MRQIGPYTILDELGRGGMGIVYRARDAAGRDVALKVLPRGKRARSLQRFQREVAALGKFSSHPHIVNVHAAGEVDQQAYFAMDLATGGSLTQRVNRLGPYAPEPAARLIADLAEGMIEAHSHGVLHRDLKPDNVLFNDAGEALVSDFGLARQVLDAESLTQSGDMLGSPGYMAPEQVSGDSDQQGERTDVYGLGATLYFALTGHAPFESEHFAWIVRATMEDRPTPPSALNPAVPSALAQLCLRCLEKDPNARYPSVAALHADLREFLAGGLVAEKRSRLAWVAGAAVVAVGVALSGLWVVVQERTGGSVAQTPAPEIPEAPPEDRPPVSATPKPKPKPRKPPLRSSWDLALTQARQFLAQGEFDEAIRHFDHARAHVPTGKAPRLEKERVDAIEMRMNEHWASGRVEEAAADSERILAIGEPIAAAARGEGESVLGGLLDLTAAADMQGPIGKAYAVRMFVLLAQGDTEGALRASELCLTITTNDRVRHEQAWIRYRQGDAQRAEAGVRACCLRLEEAEADVEHDPRGYLLLVELARERGDEAAAQQLLDMLARSVHPYGVHRAAVLLDPDRRPRLLRELKSARQTAEHSVASWLRLGRLAWDCGEHEEAERAFAEVLALEPDHRGALEDLADLCLELRRWPLAVGFAERLARDDDSRAAGLRRAACAFVGMRRYADALEAARMAIDLDPSLRVSETAADMAAGLADAGRVADARRALVPLHESTDPRLQSLATFFEKQINRITAPELDPFPQPKRDE